MIALGVGLAAQLGAQVTVAGSTALQPVLTTIAERFTGETGIEVRVSAGGSSAGVQAVRDGTADLAMVSRALSAAEIAATDATTVALDALGIIVNAGNPTESISREQLSALFSGEIRDWSELGGPSGRVAIVTRELGRTALEHFEDYTGLSHHQRDESGPAGSIARSGYRIATESEAATVVGGTPGAVGYLSFATAQRLMDQGMPIRIVALEGETPSPAGIASRSYPVVFELTIVHAEISQEASELFAFLTSQPGRELLEDYRLVPVYNANPEE